MERHEFIQKIIELYPDTFKEDRVEHVQAWVDIYERALPKSWDFDKLMWYFSTEYKSTIAPPHPSFFFTYRNDVRPESRAKNEQPKELTLEEKKAREEAKEKFFEQMRKMTAKMDINKRII